jgi:hypothetical protein
MYLSPIAIHPDTIDFSYSAYAQTPASGGINFQQNHQINPAEADIPARRYHLIQQRLGSQG